MDGPFEVDNNEITKEINELIMKEFNDDYEFQLWNDDTCTLYKRQYFETGGYSLIVIGDFNDTNKMMTWLKINHVKYEEEPLFSSEKEFNDMKKLIEILGKKFILK